MKNYIQKTGVLDFMKDLYDQLYKPFGPIQTEIIHVEKNIHAFDVSCGHSLNS